MKELKDFSLDELQQYKQVMQKVVQRDKFSPKFKFKLDKIIID